jgi:hypothetical protein
MPRHLLIGTLLIALASPALAQAPGPRGGPQAQAPTPPQAAAPQGPAMGQAGMMNMMHERMEEMMRRHHEQGASFHFKRGDGEVSVRCPSQVPLQDCVAAAIQLAKGLAQANPSSQSTQ